MKKPLFLLLFVQALFVGNALSQSLVPLTTYPEIVQQTYGYGDMIYTVVGWNTNDLSLYGFDQKGGVAKEMLTDLQVISWEITILYSLLKRMVNSMH